MLKIYCLLIFATSLFCHATFAAEPVRFKIKVESSLIESGQPLSGRLLIFMTSETRPMEMIGLNFRNPNSVWIAAKEISNLQAGETIEINSDELAFPAKFSDAPDGEYQIMALLDTNYSYAYAGAGAGDLISNVTKTKMPNSEMNLALSKIIPEKQIPVPENVKVIEFTSQMLSAFWGRPIKMQASVVLPPSYNKSKNQKYPTVYEIHGFGANHSTDFPDIPDFLQEMTDGKRPEMIYVQLNASHSLGHHVFADSVNNGPWCTALVKEFIPHLEKQFRVDGKPSGRFLLGHSSGGWSALWVMINHPDFFGGSWSTAPDPVDFRNFIGPNLTKYPPQNFYKDAKGIDYPLIRANGKVLMSSRQMVQRQQVLGRFGSQRASFEAVFSPKGFDGLPMPLFNRTTGEIDPLVQKAWEKYDISRFLRDNWKMLAPKLKDKLHVFVGTADTFHLDESVRLLDAQLKSLGSDAKIVFVEGANHSNLGVRYRIAQEMYQVARPETKTGAK